MILRELYNVLPVWQQESFFSKNFTDFEIICVNTGLHYHNGKTEDEIVIGGFYEEPMSKDWVLGLPVVNIDARENRVRIWVDG